MDPLEHWGDLIKASRPAAICAGPHRDALAKLLRERRESAEPPPWTLRRYGLALAAAVGCLVFTLLTQPRVAAPQPGAEQRELLLSWAPTDDYIFSIAAHAPLASPRRRESNAVPRQDTRPLLNQDREALDQVMKDFSSERL